MTTVGPVCHIPPTTITTPKVPVPIPAVPPPAQANLQSLQQAVNTLRQIITIITGQNGVFFNNAPGGSFTQTSVTYNTQRIYQNNDPTSPNYVDVKYVSKLVMGNNATHSTWTYNAANPNADQ